YAINLDIYFYDLSVYINDFPPVNAYRNHALVNSNDRMFASRALHSLSQPKLTWVRKVFG
ncbi:hypothetical protein, partial [Streptococcus anginosus]|uniref:hypothetical protein n=1 Tax=Streptococcus anginosus TaxID=1328 RepID=UPI002ED95938